MKQIIDYMKNKEKEYSGGTFNSVNRSHPRLQKV